MRALALLSLAFLLPVLAARGIDTSAWHTVASAAEIRALPEDVTELRCIGLDDAAQKWINTCFWFTYNRIFFPWNNLL